VWHSAWLHSADCRSVHQQLLNLSQDRREDFNLILIRNIAGNYPTGSGTSVQYPWPLPQAMASARELTPACIEVLTQLRTVLDG